MRRAGLLIAGAVAVAVLALDCRRDRPTPGPTAADVTSGEAPECRRDQVEPRAYRMVVTPQAVPEAGKEVALTLELLDGDAHRVTDLEIVHEQRLHLIIASRDLSWFGHVDPERRSDGTLAISTVFPHGGTYVLFGDFTPGGGGRIVARTELSVPGASPAPIAVAPVSLPTRATFGDFEVGLTGDRAPVAGAASVLSFSVLERGVPVTKLGDYLGARGYCAVISADTANLVHCHPLDDAGPGVGFRTVFPTPGRYKIWAELRPGGRDLVASFVIDVAAGPAGLGTVP